eukprot:1529692-Karenia_brevis.AAC.1
MEDTVRDYKDNAKVAEENMLKVLKEAKSRLSSPRWQETPPRDAVRKSRFDRYDGAKPKNAPGQSSSAGGPPAAPAA